MKKLLLLVSGLSLIGILGAKAQAIPNSGFETWGATYAQPSEPNDWVTANILAAPLLGLPNPTSVTKATAAADIHGGAAAMKIVTVKLASNPLSSSGINDTIGIALVGQPKVAPPGLKSGFQFTGRPDFFDFWYKYAPTSTDNAGALAFLTKWTGTKRDTVAKAVYYETTTIGTYTNKKVQFVYTAAYDNSGNPDTAIIGFAASVGSLDKKYPARPKLNSTMFVDDVSFTGTHIGIKEYSKNIELHVYPNPASSFVNISINEDAAVRVELFDLTGKQVASARIDDKKAKLITENLSGGLYIYRILDADKRIITAGKLNVNN